VDAYTEAGQQTDLVPFEQQRAAEVFEFVERILHINTREELFSCVIEASARLGMENIAYYALTLHESRDDETLSVVMTNFPKDWLSHYSENKYEKIDPILRYASRMPTVFEWSEVANYFQLNLRQQKLMHEAREAGLAHGLTAKIHSSPKQLAVVSFVSRFSKQLSQRDRSYWALIASQFHWAYCRIGVVEPRCLVRVSEREKECLRWTAIGKSSRDISEILAISENTVNYHLKNVMRKLGAGSRMVAVLRAVELRIISL
jgi:DNA-binding CsgD family transcriptional regulator